MDNGVPANYCPARINDQVSVGSYGSSSAGLVITIVTGIVFYKADIRLLAAESAKGIWNALIIVLIVWTAILMYQVADEAKASRDPKRNAQAPAQ